MRSFILLVCMFVINIVLRVQPLGGEVVSIPGCCKRFINGEWQIIGRDMNRCLELNTRFDQRDDIYSPQGQFWWDTECR